MLNCVENRFSYLLRWLISIGFVLALTACATGEKNRAGQKKSVSGEIPTVETGSIVFTNKTPFVVHLVRGSGRTDVVTLSPFVSEVVPNNYEMVETYYPLFDIPLTNSFSLSRIRLEDPDFYYQIDNHMEHQEIEINVPGILNDNSAYIIFTNNGRSGGVSLSRNESNNRMTGINFSGAKDNINQGETAVYRENPRDLRGLRVNPLNIKFGEMTYRNGYIYTFVFDGSSISLADSRPLHRAGENAWVKTIPNATCPMALVATGEEIQLFVSEDKGLYRYFIDSAGKGKDPVHSGESMEVTAAAQTGNSFFIAGYTIDGAYNKPIVRVHDADGAIQRLLSPSTRIEYRSAYFNTAAHKDSVWLVAGGADRGTAQADAFPVYVRLIQDNGTDLLTDWELGMADFNAKMQSEGIVCGEARSVAYDYAYDRWLITGKNLEFDSMRNHINGSYIAIISNAGVIQEIDTSFRGMSFNKLLVDHDGNYYAIGEEQKGNGSYAVVIKYNATGRQVWRSSVQPASHSYYQDAILDNVKGQIVLAGTMDAKTESGFGGIPFIETLDLEKGELLWRERLTDTASIGASVVTSIVPAPDYGYALCLSGAGEDSYTRPFIIARVNSQGKFFK